MPELPEIEVLKEEVKESLIKRKIVDVKASDKRVINLGEDEFRESLLNTVLVGVERRGKMLILRFSNGDSLLIHLMLFGQMRLVNEAKDAQVAICFDNKMWLTFSQLALGAGVHLYHEEIDKIQKVAQLGVDALSLTLDELKKILSLRKGKIKAILMDQGLISGIGSTYADEILFLAKVHPERGSKSLKEEEITLIYEHIKGVLKEAILKGGALSSDFSHLDGSKGGFIPKIHKREGEPCPLCNTQIKKITIGGRGTNYCPNCQNYFVR